MSSHITEHNLFRPVRSKSTKADITDHTARTILEAEAERRDAKTARLRAARLAKEAVLIPAPSPVKRRRSKAA
jgi:hypothetical protein